jgi:hypothetical protein
MAGLFSEKKAEPSKQDKKILWAALALLVNADKDASSLLTEEDWIRARKLAASVGQDIIDTFLELQGGGAAN